MNETDVRHEGDVFIKYQTLPGSDPSFVATRVPVNQLLFEARPGERGEAKTIFEKVGKLLRVAERAVKRSRLHTHIYIYVHICIIYVHICIIYVNMYYIYLNMFYWIPKM